MSQLLDSQYWFALWPGDANLPFWRVIIIIASLQIIAAIVIHLMARRRADTIDRRWLWRLRNWASASGIIFLVLAFFRLQNAYFLSMRFFVFGWIAASGLWLLWLIKILLRDLPRRRKSLAERETFQKYLPVKKS